MRKLTTEEFVKKAKEIHGDKYDYSKTEYHKMREKVCIICPEHGEFWQNPYSHITSHGCSKCVGLNKSTKEEFILKARQIHGWKYDYSKVEYINAKTKVCIVCPVHGEFWQTPNDHLTGYECPECGHNKTNIKQTLTFEQFIEKARNVHGDKYDYSKVEYKKSSTKVCIICPVHGEFWQTPNKHLSGNGCPKCRNSYLENEIVNFLKENDIKFEQEKTFDWLKYKSNLFLDFYLPEYNIAIECQGLQHFEPVDCFGGKTSYEKLKKRDKIKYELCEKNNLKLIYFIKHKEEYYVDNNIYSSNIFKNKKELLSLLYEFIRNN